MCEFLDSLRTTPSFRTMSDTDLLTLIDGAVRMTYGRGSTLFRRGDAAERYFLVLSGRIVLHYDDPGDPLGTSRVVGPGEVVADASICAVGTYPVTAQALADTETLAMDAAPLRRLLEERFDLMVNVLGGMSAGLRELVRQIGEIKMKTAAQRVALYLVRLAPCRAGPAEVRLPHEKKLLASQLGMKPETLSRALARLHSLGVSATGGNSLLRIEEVEQLRSFAQQTDCDAALGLEWTPEMAVLQPEAET
jgi:CRP-like cAMP-binding protein